MFLAIIGVVTNGWTLRNIRSTFNVAESGFYLAILVHCVMFLISCSVNALVCVSFLFDYRPEWICFLFHFSIFPSDFAGLLIGLGISVLRFHIVSGSMSNNCPIPNGAIKLVSGLSVLLATFYILGCYVLFLALDVPWTIFLEICRFTEKARVESQWTNLLFGPPVILIALLTLGYDFRLMYFLRKISSAGPNSMDKIKIPIRATILSALWIIPLLIMAVFIIPRLTSPGAEAFLLFLYYRIAHFLKAPLMFWMTFSHKKQRIREQDRIRLRQIRLEKVHKAALIQRGLLKNCPNFDNIRIQDLENGNSTLHL